MSCFNGLVNSSEGRPKMISVDNLLLNWLPLLFLLCFFCSGCAKSWIQVDESLISEISEGVTTKKDILSMFGNPNSRNILSGNEIWSYEYLSGNIIAGMESRVLNIHFNDDSVKGYRSLLPPSLTKIKRLESTLMLQ